MAEADIDSGERLAVAEVEFDSGERLAGGWVAGKHTAAAAAVALDLDPHSTEPAESVNWDRPGQMVESKSSELRILRALVVSSWARLCPRIAAE